MPPPGTDPRLCARVEFGRGVVALLMGVELRNVCCLSIPHLRPELHGAVKAVRCKPRMIKGFFRGATL
jgi:hypothetical protein